MGGAEASLTGMTGLLATLLAIPEAQINTLFAVFTRVGAFAALLPGFGERAVPTRVRLFGALALTALAWPLVAGVYAPGGLWPGAPGVEAPPLSLGRLLIAEAVAGLAIGAAVRAVLWALQLAASIASQATSIIQVMGAGVTPDPMPAIGNLLTVAAIALALAAGLGEKAVIAVARSYEVLPYGVFPVAGDFARWGLERASAAFGLAVALATPFLAVSLAYNIALGAINRAMPQLMVVLVGAPAITGGAILLMAVAAPTILIHWHDAMDVALADPFGIAP